jgi:hypothetical protein
MNAPARVSLGGKMVPMLAMEDIIALVEELHEAQRLELRTDLLASAVGDQERVRALREFEQDRGSLGPFFRWAGTMRGADRIIRFACAKNGIGNADAVIGSDIRAALALAASLVVPPRDRGAEGNDGAETEEPPNDSPSTTNA